MSRAEDARRSRSQGGFSPAQILGRARRAIQSSTPKVRPAPPLREVFPLPAPATRNAHLVGPTTVEFLGLRAEVDAASAWTDPARSPHWLCHLHRFEDLRATGGEQRALWNEALIERWIDEHPPGASPGWHLFTTSRRVVNWIRWARTFERSDRFLVSLATQTRHIERNLGSDLIGVELLVHAKALLFAGAYFAGREAERWLDKGLALLRRELTAQVLGDGGHIERSPMHHSVLLEDVLDLIALVRWTPAAFGPADELSDKLTRVADSMLQWLGHMTHPDGGIALFNESALGYAPPPSALSEYAQRLGLRLPVAPQSGVVHLAQSGYIRIERGRCVLFLDVGETGPQELAGRAHADTLSFESSVDGARLVVNGGTSTSLPGPEFLRQRGTAAHSTVEVDGLDSSDLGPAFRAPKHAVPFDLHIDDGLARIEVSCSHDGYRRLPGDVVHRRSWLLDERSLRITDRLRGEFASAVGRLHLHPYVALDAQGLAVAVHRPNGTAARIDALAGTLEVAPGVWSPCFGGDYANQHVRCLPGNAGIARTQIAW